MLLTFCCVQMSVAQVSYGVFSNGTLTLYYNDKYNSNSMIYWSSVAKDVKKVVFDKSFAKYKPVSTVAWFLNFVSATEFAGLENLNTSEVLDMSFMFKNCYNLSVLDLSTFDTKNVEYITGLFDGCVNLTTVFASDKWDVKKLYDLNLDTTTLEKLDGGDTTVVIVNEGLHDIFKNCSKLRGGKGSTEGKIIIDGGESNPGLLTRKGDKTVLPKYSGVKPYVVFNNGVLTFYYNDKYPQNAYFDFYFKQDSIDSWEINPFADNVTKVVFDESFKNYSPKTCKSWFHDYINLTEIVNLKYLNTSSVTNMSELFCNCTKLKSLDLSNFNTSNVEDMTEMFAHCINLTSLNFSKFFYTARCLSMYAMFSGCEKLTSLDLSSFKTSEVYHFQKMFSKCKNLSKIYVSKYWTINDSVSDDDSRYMFFDCPNLVGGKGTKYDPEKINLKYAKIDGGESAPGYFTEK